LISLIGLIIVTGLLVDNTVVIADNAYRKMQEGESPEDAVVEGTYEVWASVTAAALVTISVFVPMAFMTGIFGKFVREIPISVIVALSVTLLQGFIILPSLILRWVRARPLSQVTAQGTSRFKQTWENWVQKVFGAYQSSLKRAVQKRYWVLLGAAGLLVGSIVFAGQFMRVILFPPDGIEQFFVRIEGPTPTSLQGTTELVQSVERTVAKLPPSELESYSTQVGVHQNDPGDPATRRGSQLAQVWIFLTNSQTRERTADEIIEGLRKELGTPPGVTRISFARVQGGPPVGMPISIGIQGEDYAEIQRAAERIKAIAAAVPGARDVIDSYLLGKEEVRVRINGAEARAAQLTVRDAGAAVRAAFDGIVATSIRSLDEEVDVRVSLKTDGRDIRGILANLSVPNAQGDLVPLSRIATFEKGQSLAVYEHEDNRREIRVYGEVDVETTSAQKVNAEINRLLPEVRKDFPNLRIVFGGEDRDTQESFAALGRSFIVALLGMFLILVALFKKISQPVLLIISIPLGVISVIWTLFFHGMPISFMAILGIISLAGVIVNNAIVLIDFINQARSRGLDRFESIYDAASIRLRPIVLTSISAVVGVMPTAYGIGGLDMFVVPIALALGWGLIFGQILTVYVLPCAVAAVDDVVDWIDRRVKKVPA
jgi:multidrug efflux pump subunit AcrB